jgi:hypothetical protein
MAGGNDAHKLGGGRRGLGRYCCTLRGVGRGGLFAGCAQIWQHRGDAMCTRSAGISRRQSRQASKRSCGGCSCCDSRREVRQMDDGTGGWSEALAMHHESSRLHTDVNPLPSHVSLQELFQAHAEYLACSICYALFHAITAYGSEGCTCASC